MNYVKKVYIHAKKTNLSNRIYVSKILVPELCNYEGWALFIHCDFIFREDVRNRLTSAMTDMQLCVQHDYQPKDGKEKMDGKIQHNYPRKNWSSCVLWNCSHPANKAPTKELVNNPETTGKYLHRFSWLDDSPIGRIQS